jgi:hypothetical protein
MPNIPGNGGHVPRDEPWKSGNRFVENFTRSALWYGITVKELQIAVYD